MLDRYERIAILDFGSQYTEMIARAFRDLGICAEIWPATVSSAILQERAPRGIVLSGGPQSVREHHTLRAPDAVFTQGVPVLGICYGMQTMAVQLGGQVASGAHHEFGMATVQVDPTDPLLGPWCAAAQTDAAGACRVWMSHGDSVTQIPPGFRITASNTATPVAAMSDPQRHWYGIQFHPEVTHTPQGRQLFARFADLCGIQREAVPAITLSDRIGQIRETVGNQRVLLGVSGGVDSSVLAVLLQQAIGDQLICVLVDHGLMRLDETEQVIQQLGAHGIAVQVVHAANRFFAALKGVVDPEQKRKMIGRLFIEAFAEKAQTLGPIAFLAQGTIYSDVIESAASGSAKAVIKSHHNVGGLPDQIPFRVLEPFRDLFKDEVRHLGRQLGIPDPWIDRHPFPGPGLGVRVLGEVTPERVALLQQVDAIFMDALIQSGWYAKTSQAFAVLLPVQSVAVKGDARHYEAVVALRAVHTDDYMTAHITRFPLAWLESVATRIINEVRGVSRVVYDLSTKPPATIEWE